MAMKIEINSDANFWHLAPGRQSGNHFIWNELKNGDTLGYEWCLKSLKNLKRLNKNVKHYDIIKRFTGVKKGDYICVISGKKLLGIAETIIGYRFPFSNKSSKTLNNLFKKGIVHPFQTVKVKWLRQFNSPEPELNTSAQPAFVSLKDNKRWISLVNILMDNGFSFDDKFNKSNDLQELSGLDKKKRIKLKEHLKWEWKRDQKFVKDYKKRNEHKGCYVCQFKSKNVYIFKKIKPFLELHHIEPLSQTYSKRKHLSNKNVALLCPNCHRAIHRIMTEHEKNTISINAFKKNYLI